jgi:hypothetical protein
MSRNKPPTVASGNFMLRDFAIFQIKLILDGGKDSFAFLGVHRCGDARFRCGQVRFSTTDAGLGFSGQMHDIHPVEDRLIVVTSGDFALAPLAGFVGIGPVEVVVNWFTELRERMGEGN